METEYGSLGVGYVQTVARKLIEDIKSKGLKNGEKLMPLRQLAEKYDTSYPTMRKAINLLADKGILSSRQGSGVYVTQSTQLQPARTRQKLAVLLCGFDEYIASDRVYTDLLYGIEQEATQCDAEISVSFIRNPEELVGRELYTGSDGFLIVGTDVPGLKAVLKDKPVVWVMASKKSWGDHVSYDNRQIGILAAEELVASGRKKLICINVHEGVGDERCRAFKEHAESLGANVLYLNHPEALIQTRKEQHIDFGALSSWVDQIEKGLPERNGVFVVDMVAAPLYTMLKERGIRPGKDIKIATSNWRDYVVGRTQHQPINILVHSEEIGSVAVQQLRWRIQNPNTRRRIIRLEPEVGSASPVNEV